MEIIPTQLNFLNALVPNKTGLENDINKKILVFSKSIGSLSVQDLNYKYQSHFSGIPFHYFIDSLGNIYYCRNRAYQNELFLNDYNLYANSVSILIDNPHGTTLGQEKENALVSLCSMLCMQESVLLENILSLSEIIYDDVDIPNMNLIVGKIRKKISDFSSIASIETDYNTLMYYKLIVNHNVLTFNDLSELTGVPVNIIISMNPQSYVIEYDLVTGYEKEINGYTSIIPFSTMFLPKNKFYYTVIASAQEDLSKSIVDSAKIFNKRLEMW